MKVIHPWSLHHGTWLLSEDPLCKRRSALDGVATWFGHMLNGLKEGYPVPRSKQTWQMEALFVSICRYLQLGMFMPNSQSMKRPQLQTPDPKHRPDNQEPPLKKSKLCKPPRIGKINNWFTHGPKVGLSQKIGMPKN